MLKDREDLSLGQNIYFNGQFCSQLDLERLKKQTRKKLGEVILNQVAFKFDWFMGGEE